MSQPRLVWTPVFTTKLRRKAAFAPSALALFGVERMMCGLIVDDREIGRLSASTCRESLQWEERLARTLRPLAEFERTVSAGCSVCSKRSFD